MWVFERDEFKDLLQFTSKEERIENLQKWKKKWKIPMQVCFAQRDKELLVDFDNELSVLEFIGKIEKLGTLELTEYLFKSNSIVQDTNGNSYHNEFIGVVFPNQELVKGNEKNTSTTNTTRVFVPGSEWLYFKFYCGIESSNRILVRLFTEFLKVHVNQNLIDNWFFVRHKDPEHHLRLRIHVNGPHNIGPLLTEFNQLTRNLYEAKLIWKVQIESYIRELERYGSRNMDNCETIFGLSSLSVLNAIEFKLTKKEKNLEWNYALLSIDQFLSAFGFDLQDKERFTSWMKNHFGREFNLEDKAVRLSLDRKYRQLQVLIRELFEIGSKELKDIMAQRSDILRDRCQRIYQHEYMTNSAIHMSDSHLFHIISSLIHMDLNRIFATDQRFNEFTVYYLISKFYKSKIAREKSRR